jgi:DNA-binding GntR family transcriptional regulator
MTRKLSLNGQTLRRLSKPGSLSERIYGDLRTRLQRCEIGPEDRLVDTEIAGSYGTSRMPVREALMRLANEGYLVGTTRGFVLPRLSARDYRDIFEVRRLLEPQAAASAAANLDQAGRRELTRAVEDARAAIAEDDADRLIQANARFRAVWLGAVGNPRLAETIARFVDHVQMVRLGTLMDPATRQVVIRGLEGLHDAFLRGDGEAAQAQMSAFIAAAEQAFARTGRSDGPASPGPRSRSVPAAAPAAPALQTSRAAQEPSR